jgi:hypothetical protein
MTALRAYRDDGLLAGWIAGIAAGPRAGARPLAWLVPPFVRAIEYGTLIGVAAVADPDALPLCFAFLAVLAFHHYDIVYRLRHQRTEPPAWLQITGGGWDGRILVFSLLAFVDALRFGFLVAAVALGGVYVVESVSSWMRAERGQHAAVDTDGDEVLE